MATPTCVKILTGPFAGLPCPCRLTVTAVCPRCQDPGASLAADLRGGAVVVCESCGHSEVYPDVVLDDALKGIYRKAAQ